VVEPDDEHTTVGPGWVGADVAQSPIERDQQAAVGGSTGPHVRVVRSVESFRMRSVRVVAGIDQRGERCQGSHLMLSSGGRAREAVDAALGRRRMAQMWPLTDVRAGQGPGLSDVVELTGAFGVPRCSPVIHALTCSFAPSTLLVACRRSGPFLARVRAKCGPRVAAGE
jgi:hypothetical protein